MLRDKEGQALPPEGYHSQHTHPSNRVGGCKWSVLSHRLLWAEAKKEVFISRGTAVHARKATHRSGNYISQRQGGAECAEGEPGSQLDRKLKDTKPPRL